MMSALLDDVPLLTDPAEIPPRLPVPHVLAVGDSRPPAQTWPRSAEAAQAVERQHQTPAAQPALFTFNRQGADVAQGTPRPGGHRIHVVADEWPVDSRSPLPDARSWCASLALAVAEALLGRRPVGQLSRWVDEGVLATLTITLRQRRAGTSPVSRPPVLRSVHLQRPRAGSIEASAHLQLDGRSTAFAFRLEQWYDRWLCTALELGPRGTEL
jgi:hypothetical protein